MPLILSPVLLSELDAVHRLRLSINADQPIERFLFPNGASDISVATSAAQDRQGMADPKCAFRQVVVKDSESGDIVSYALWYFFTGSEERDGEEGVVGAGWLGGGWPSDANKEALDALVEEGTKKRKALMGTRPHAYLAFLCTSPRHRCQGAASQLVQWGLSLADSHHLPVYFQAPLAGNRLYLKYGFEEAATLTIELNRWSIPHTIEHRCMIRTASPPLSTETISISEFLTNADFYSFPTIEDAAFAGTAIADLVFPPGQPTELPTSNQVNEQNSVPVRGLGHIACANTETGCRYEKAFFPGTGRVIGLARWYLYDSPSTPHAPPTTRFPEGGNAALGEYFFSSMHQTQEKHMQGQPYVYLRTMAVLPEFSRRGIGAGLLQRCLQHADARGLKAWVQASPAGLGLYRKFGWEEVERWEIPLEEWGGKEGQKITMTYMLREPKRNGMMGLEV